MLKQVALALLCSLLSVIGHAQQHAVDSLKKLLATQNDPTQKALLLAKICELARYTSPVELKDFAAQLKAHGKVQNNVIWTVEGDYFTAIYHLISGRTDTAILIVEKNIPILQKDPSQKLLLSKHYSLSGNCLMKLNRQREALAMFFSFLRVAEDIEDKDMQFKAYNNIGWAYMELSQFALAVDNLTRSVNIIRENNFPDRYGTIYNNLASSYGSLGLFDSSYKYAQKGIATAEKYNDYAALANGYNILGTFLAKQNRYDEALANFLKAKPIREKMGDPFFIVSDLSEIALLQSKLGAHGEGIKNSLDALAIAEKYNIDAKLPMIYLALANNYEAAGNFSAATDTYKKLNNIKDSIYADANPRALAEIRTQYETEKQQRLIEQQKFRLTRQNYLMIGAGALLVLGGLLGYTQYRRYKFKKEAQLQSELREQQEASTKAVLEAEENERQRIAKDLHDGVGQMMSAAKMNLSAFESDLALTDHDKQLSLEKIIALVDESCKEVRHVSHNMMPNALLKHSLAAAVREFIEKIDKKALEVHLYTEGLNERLDSNVEIVLYRVIQECVNNVIKHAGATTLDISIIKDKDGISATIEDNGRGFDTSNRDHFDGIGLKNIITRVEYLKGTIDFDSKPGKGTVVGLHVPINS
jgi:two-component system, NarL family, sensor kinase